MRCLKCGGALEHLDKWVLECHDCSAMFRRGVLEPILTHHFLPEIEEQRVLRQLEAYLRLATKIIGRPVRVRTEAVHEAGYKEVSASIHRLLNSEE